jgi:peptidoglycan/xylan/chitin deacetylase (PgdA/CDA1 family)
MAGSGAVAMAGAWGGPEHREARLDLDADLVSASLSQAGRRLIATVRTTTPLLLGRLDRLPRRRAGHDAYLCFELHRRGAEGARLLCLGDGGDVHRRVGLELVNGRGGTTGKKTLPARVGRPGPRRLVLALIPGEAGLSPHRYRWRVVEDRGGCAGRTGSCPESLPANGYRVFRLSPVRAIGCTGAAPVLDSSGPRDRRAIALTFDDGPSEYTPAFLDVLRDEHVDATFFEIGQEMAGRERTMRRILREGSEIGNHTMHHTTLPGYSEIAEADSLIEAATSFRPCLFRPPGGSANAGVVRTAAELGMRTITWDVDPSDWANPGSGAVYGRVVDAARPGSIVILHDGGGNRSGTLAALPRIIETLRGRGYRLATVSELLGERLIYRPYG